MDSDDDAIGDRDDPDDDNDGVADSVDSCLSSANADQRDRGADGIGDVCDDTQDFCWTCLPGWGGWRSTLPW